MSCNPSLSKSTVRIVLGKAMPSYWRMNTKPRSTNRLPVLLVKSKPVSTGSFAPFPPRSTATPMAGQYGAPGVR
ncbi:hypothetical protein AOZ06_24985 [Kibdelosporangium phytohabitans]|uniref:Uncharacterized protein n=1 Tax=Kibdelosporangium phytohabitans TaxID=860235 RepID=A0A0N9I4H6_9PSEU|nr:hypothetical protein AOZ06_24985 [Kibdelosporangium phytohabitans]